MNDQSSHDEVTLARTLTGFNATMIGLGAMIGAGVFVLTGIAAGEAGPAAIVAFVLNGIVTTFTAFTYAELASTIPEAGGGYAFVKRAYPGVVGFISGWMLWFAYTVACSLYAVGFGGYFIELLESYFPFISHAFVGLVGHGNAISQRDGRRRDGQGRKRDHPGQGGRVGFLHRFWFGRYVSHP
jgi:amino acid transporter